MVTAYTVAGNIGRTPCSSTVCSQIEDPAGYASNAKDYCTLAAQLALTGLELRIVQRAGGVRYNEVRYGAQARTCSTLHGVSGVLAALGGGA